MNTILRQLTKYSLPVSRAAIIEIYSLIKGHKISRDMSELVVWLKSIGIKVDSEKDMEELRTLQRFFKGELSGNEESRLFTFLNKHENNIYGGYNIWGWPLGGHHVFMLTRGAKRDRLQPESCQVLLELNSRSFEKLWFKMELVNCNLAIGIICSSDKYRKVLNGEAERLCQTLQSAGYRIDNIVLEVNNSPLTILDFIPNDPTPFYDINYQV